MPKGFFSQGFVILLEGPVTLERIAKRLTEFRILGQKDGSEQVEISGPATIVEYRPEVNGMISIDLVSSPWPDHMGDPKREPMLMGAWSMGYFGPFTYPWGLRRAVEQCRRWKAARETWSIAIARSCG